MLPELRVLYIYEDCQYSRLRAWWPVQSVGLGMVVAKSLLPNQNLQMWWLSHCTASTMSRKQFASPASHLLRSALHLLFLICWDLLCICFWQSFFTNQFTSALFPSLHCSFNSSVSRTSGSTLKINHQCLVLPEISLWGTLSPKSLLNTNTIKEWPELTDHLPTSVKCSSQSTGLSS